MNQINKPGPVVQFFGWLLMAVGVLVALTTGACTLYVLASLAASGTGGYGSTGEWVWLSLLLGGVPCIIGIALFFGGRALARPPKGRRLPPRPIEDPEDRP